VLADALSFGKTEEGMKDLWLPLTCQSHQSSACGNACWPGWLPGVPGGLPCERIGAEENSI
jgi:hypothetical protein